MPGCRLGWSVLVISAIAFAALTACGSGTSTPLSSQHPATTRRAGASATSAAPTSSPTLPIQPTPPPAYPDGSSTVPATCPVEVSPPVIEDTSSQDEPITQVVVIHEYPVRGTSALELLAQM